MWKNPIRQFINIKFIFSIQQQVPMDYYNSMLPQNQPPMMPSMHYPQMAQPEIGQDLWDHEKHVSLQQNRKTSDKKLKQKF